MAGKISELQNTKEKAVKISQKNILDISEFGDIFLKTKKIKIKHLNDAVEDFKKDYIIKSLKATDSNISKCSELLGIDKKNLNSFISKYEIIL
ncbi:hypothetical protein KA977_12055 [Candidatus Dependentiae bacterium]|nr:hypothetical protein [Candidatus Dependentiae bacterium]